MLEENVRCLRSLEVSAMLIHIVSYLLGMFRASLFMKYDFHLHYDYEM